MKNVIKQIDARSPLRRKVKPGWELLSVNGRPILDVLDYKYYSYESRLALEFLTPEGKRKIVRVKKAEGEDPGLTFESYLMDRPRSCANDCVFCFIDQNPPGMRKSVYFKDDDTRLSFLMGCYITLTNLSEREIRRIIDLHISPVNISVHAADPALRRTLLRSPRAGEALAIMRRFAEAGIRMNCQIVCCPGYNDGDALTETLEALKALHPAVNSVSVVPVGLTKHRENLPALRAFTPESAAETVALVTRFGEACLAERGTRLAYCGDELFLKAGLEIPPEEYYEDYPQLENGVGMLRLTESEFFNALKMINAPGSAQAPDGVPFSIATGAAAAPLMEKLLAAAKAKARVLGKTLDGRVHTIRNEFFGESVTVAGLITGGDLISQLREGKFLGERLLISDAMLRREELDFLDGVTLAEASAALGVPVYPVPSNGAALCRAMFGCPPDLPERKKDIEITEYNKYN